jgi:hypothetical protein
MKKWIFAALVLISVCANPVLLRAQEKKGDKAGVNQISTADRAKQEKDVLIANINGLRNQEFRVAILQQIVNEELEKLRNLEAVFSDQYKLNVEKFRQGLYRYDDKLGKIVEQPAPAGKK